MRPAIQRSIVLAVVLCGCDGTEPSEGTVLASTLGDITTAEVRFSAGLGKGGAPEVGAGGPVPSDCPYVTANATFVCPKANIPGTTVLRSYQLLDANGDPLAKFERTKVEAIKLVSSVSDTIITTAWSLAYVSSSTLTLSGLLGGMRVINGSAATNSAITWNSNNKTRSATVIQTVTNVEPAPLVNATGEFPNAGTVTSVIAGIDTTGIALPTTNVVTTFNSSNTVAVQIQQSGVTVLWECQYWTAGGVNLIACRQP